MAILLMSWFQNVLKLSDIIKRYVDKSVGAVVRCRCRDICHIVALHISKSLTHKVVDNPPQWFKEQFEELFEQL